jgi:hypothetical protein
MNFFVIGGLIAGVFGVGFISAVVLVSIGFAILAGLALATVAVVAAALLILTTRKNRIVIANVSSPPVVAGRC